MDSKTYLNLKFNNRNQEFLFKEFLLKMRYFKPALQFVFEDNIAYFNLPGYPAWLAVFPYEDEGLHFEIARDLKRKVDLNEAVPVFVNDLSDLEAVISALKVLFICAPSLCEADTPIKQTVKKPASKPMSENTKQSGTKKGQPGMERVIEKFFE